MEEIKKLEYGQLNRIVGAEEINKVDYKDKVLKIKSDELERYINVENFSKMAVLGIDIYQYSQYESLQQSLIPFLFKKLYDATVKFCNNHNKYYFQKTKGIREFRKYFIDTGDGGFQIFGTPLHSIIFAIGFASIVRAYNSNEKYPRLKEIIGEINLRFTITFDDIFSFMGNYYGPSIINNARILSKDRLNRFLIDENTYKWFMQYTHGIETLTITNFTDLKQMQDFQNYDDSFMTSDNKNIFFSDRKEPYRTIRTVDILKIGNIQAKEKNLSIYNLHIQVDLRLREQRTNHDTKFVISVGNLNTMGISDNER
jgi:hypothetical protein